MLRLLWQQRLSTDLRRRSTLAASLEVPVDKGMRAALRPGTRLAYDGQRWEVAELTPPSVLLAGPAGELRRVSISHLLAAPGTRLPGSPRRGRPGRRDGVSGLDDAELAELRERVAHVQEAWTGYRDGSAGAGPARRAAAGVRARRPSCQRYAGQGRGASASGCARSAAGAADLEERGPAGLVDDRWRRYQSPEGGADARWLEMARRVLAEHTEASTPTKDLILAKIAARLEAEHGDGAVPVPRPDPGARPAAGDQQGHQRVRRAEGQAGDRRPPGRALRAAAGDAAR